MKSLKNRAYNWLRWSEKYTKTDMVYLARGGFWLTLGQGVASVSTFLLAIAFANLLPRETYGTYKYILAIGGTLAIFTLTGMGTAVTQATARGLGGIIKSAFQAKLRWGLVGSLVSFLGAGYYYLNGNITLSLGLLIIGIFMPFMESLSLYDSVWQGKKRFDVSTKYFAIGQVSCVALSILALLFTTNVLILVLIYFASWTAFRTIFYRNTLQKIKTEEPKETEVASTLSYGKHLSLMGVMGVVANYADRILVFHYVGAVEAAIYSIAIAVPEQIKGLFKNVGALALPKFSEKPEEETRKAIWGKIGKFALILLLITVLYILVAPFIFKILFPQYLDSVIYSQIFSLSFVAAISVIPVSILQAHAKKEKLYLLNIITPVVQLFLLFVGVYFGAVFGIVLARIISRFINTIISFRLISD